MTPGLPDARLTWIMPCRNEADALRAPVLHEFIDRLPLMHADLVLVDDGSTDATWSVMRDLTASQRSRVYRVANPQPGLVNALREGVRFARGDWVGFVMADMPEAVSDLVRLSSRATGSNDCVFGDRWSHPVVTGYPRWKRVLNRLGNHVVGLQLGPHLGRHYSDWSNLCKLYRRSWLYTREWQSQRFAIGAEMATRAVLRGARVAVVPTSWTERTAGRSKYQWADGWATWAAVQRVRHQERGS